jgi:hypothetical protein
MPFFECLPYCFQGDTGHLAQHDQLLGQELQGPAAASLGRGITHQFEQGLFDGSLDFDLLWTGRAGPRVEGRIETLQHKALAHPMDGGDSHFQCLLNVFIQARRAIETGVC